MQGDTRPVAGWGELVTALDAAALAEDEHAPHVVVLVDKTLGSGPATGPFGGIVEAFAAAERLEAVLNDGNPDSPVKARVLRLFSPG
jgi:hypothetical protein